MMNNQLKVSISLLIERGDQVVYILHSEWWLNSVSWSEDENYYS